MKRSKTYFISDLHLGASYIPDPRAHEEKVVRWLKSIEQDCGRLYLVGDILDYWYEYRHVVPRGFVRFFGQLAAMHDSGVEITWFIGNHDIWIFDYLPGELGVKVVDGALTTEIDGKRFYICHGDAVGRQKRSFRFIRRMFRNKVCQRLYSAIHPGLTIPFAHGWSASSRKKEEAMNVAPQVDIKSVEYWAHEFAAKNPEIDYLVLGHYHVLLNEKVGEECRLIILGDWINKFSYAVFDHRELKLEKYS